MPNLGTGELIIILIIVILVFGAGKIPKIASDLGKGIREFRKAARGESEEPEKPGEKTIDAGKKT